MKKIIFIIAFLISGIAFSQVRAKQVKVDATAAGITSTNTQDALAEIQSSVVDLGAAVDLKADDSNVVHKLGVETIGGRKTFSGVTEFGMEIHLEGSIFANRNGLWLSSTNEDPVVSGTKLLISNTGRKTRFKYWDISFTLDGSTLNRNTSYVLPNKSGTIALLDDVSSGILDAVPTDGSANGVESNGVFDELAKKPNLYGFSDTNTYETFNVFQNKTTFNAVDFNRAIKISGNQRSLVPNSIDLGYGGLGVLRLSDENTASIDFSGITSDRAYTLPNKSGTVALLDDISSGNIPADNVTGTGSTNHLAVWNSTSSIGLSSSLEVLVGGRLLASNGITTTVIDLVKGTVTDAPVDPTDVTNKAYVDNKYITKTDTGTTIDLSSNTQDNFLSASSATTFTLVNIEIGGYAEVLINAATEPVVTGATKFPNTASFIASTDMILCVKDFNGIRKFWFVEF